MQGMAIISDCGFYRYRLERVWGDGPAATFCMLNPSTADAALDDPTIRRCIDFARREDCGRLIVVNLHAWRATKPAELRLAADPVGPLNREHLLAAAEETEGPLIAAWGGWGPPETGAAAAELFGPRLQCLGMTQDGRPRHPLYLRKDAELRAWPAA